MINETLDYKLSELKSYLNRNWKGLSDHFVDRLIAKAEYDRLIKEKNEIHTK